MHQINSLNQFPTQEIAYFSQASAATRSNPDLSFQKQMDSQRPQWESRILSTHFDKQTATLALTIEHHGPQDAEISFHPAAPGNSSSKCCLFFLVHKKEKETASPLPRTATIFFDFRDPKYRPFLDHFSTREFALFVIDFNDRFLRETIVKPNDSSHIPRYTTFAIGEEGQDGGHALPSCFDRAAEKALDLLSSLLPSKKSGSGLTTLAIGEEGQDSGYSNLSTQEKK